jgi:quercetin dioxygenase-like cupin family protein
MTRRNLIGGCVMVALLAASFIAARAQAPAPANTTFKRTVLQQADLSAPGREVVQALAEIQPAGASGRHTHPGEEIAYVLAGPVVLEIDGKPAKTLQTGDVFLIPAGAIHNARNTGKGVAKVVATYVIEKGKPVATPVQ